MRRRAVWVLLVMALGVGVGVPPAAATEKQRPLRISMSDWSSRRLGPWELDEDRTFAAARYALGRETSCDGQEESDTAAIVRWRRLGVEALFELPRGGDGKHRICDRFAELVLSTAFLTGSRWETSRGLRVGATTSRVRALYPNAGQEGGGWVLLLHVDFEGDDSHPALTAQVHDGRVTAFTVAYFERPS